MDKFKIEVINSFTNELKNYWQEFEKKSHHYIFQTYEWQKLWLDKNAKYGNFLINYTILVFEKDELIMLLPLNVKNFYSIKILNWSGFPFSDYNAPLIAKNKTFKEDDFRLIWKLILNKIKKIDCITFNNQPEYIVSQKNPFFSYLTSKIDNEYYGIELNKFEVNKNELNNIEYQISRLRSLGNLKYKKAYSITERNKIINFIISNKIKQYENTNAWNLFKNKIYHEFFIHSNLSLHEKAYITYLEIDDKVIAAHSGYIYEKICYYLFPVYNINYSKYSPGKILLKKMIDESKQNMLHYFDLTIGSENYKKKYSNKKFSSSFFLKTLTFKGILYIILLKIKFNLKNILNNLKKND